jgi:hypothetical protein
MRSSNRCFKHSISIDGLEKSFRVKNIWSPQLRIGTLSKLTQHNNGNSVLDALARELETPDAIIKP